MAAQISSFDTRTTPSTNELHRRSVSSPMTRTAVPSLNRPTSESSTRSRRSRLCARASASYVSTPITLTCGGATRLMYAATPLSKPPPPTAQNTASTCSISVWRQISTATVPCPVMTWGWSKGGMTVRPCVSASRAHSALASSKFAPWNRTLAPRRWTFSHLILGVPMGMTIVHGIERCAPDMATPCAWLPALQAMTPFHLRWSSSCRIILYAPRNLKLYTGCRSSRFSKISQPKRLDNLEAGCSGVCRAKSYRCAPRIIRK